MNLTDQQKLICKALWGPKSKFGKAFAASLIAALSSCQPELVTAVWKPEYAQLAPSIQQWYKDAKMTPETKERLNKRWSGCCDEADVVKDAEFKVVYPDGVKDPEWWYRRPGMDWKLIHPDTVHWGENAPDSKATLFVYKPPGGGIAPQELCFYPAGGA